MGIKDKFDEISGTYERQRKQLIPCFDDFYNVPLATLDFAGDNPRVLDLGCGPGLYTSLLLRKYPRAVATLVDLSDKMLAIAKERFADRPDYRFIQADFADMPVEGPFDIIVSGLAIHHLPGPQKRSLYKRCHELLVDGGVFVNSDQILGPTKLTDDLSMGLWKKAMMDSGIEREEVLKAYERMKFDQPSTVADQLDWLREAGFAEVDCIYKYLPLAVFYAKK